jgi:lysozyme family protein
MSAFAECHKITHRWEKGYADHPRDPGGATLDGVTQRVYDAWRVRQRLHRRPVRQMTPGEAEAIFHTQFWQAVQGDRLPPGIDLAVYDFAVNSGPSRAIRYLQAALGVKQDGHLGEVTLAAALEAYRRNDDAAVIRRIMAARESFLRALPIFPTFGKGWLNRTRDVREQALRMERIENSARAFATKAREDAPAAPAGDPTIYRPDKAEPPADPATRADRAAKGGGMLAALAAVASAVQAAIGGVKETLDGVVPGGSAVALAIVLTAATLAGLYAWQQWREARE